MISLELLAALVGIAAALVFFLTALRALGELMNQWAGEADDEAVPPADHPYKPNGGLRGAAPSFHAPVQVLPSRTAAPRLNGTLPGRRKDNAHDRIDAEPSTLPN